MAEIILFPTHKDYCMRCVHCGASGNCLSKEYNTHASKINCVWKYCPYRRENAAKVASVLLVSEREE